MIDGPLLQPLPAERLSHQGSEAAELLFVNPPSPDGDTWIRCQHRAGQRAPDGTVWPQTALAQLCALFPDRQVAILDAAARRLSWQQLALELERHAPRWYVTQLGGPTLQNDLQGVVLAKQAGAETVVFGPIVTPVARELLQHCPALDYVLCGEPELTLRELVDTVDRCQLTPAGIAPLFGERRGCSWRGTLGAIPGLAWRHGGEPVINAPRPLMARLDDLPLPRHELLPLGIYRGPAIQAPAAMVVTGRGCPGCCSFCLKHVTYGHTVRLRSPESILEELLLLQRLGVRHVYMQADLFTVCRDQVAGLCRLMLAEGLRLRWSCNSRPDTVDDGLLQLMGRAGCRRITWAIESASDALLWRNGKGTRADEIERTVGWARAAGIESWGSFILGLPGETE
ncbi:MAG: radical SAM protein, partial [Anaerolineae bacterium]|nr:radical SAM protein [Anaerolineae bacterium]